jgi:hypothetical protein
MGTPRRTGFPLSRALLRSGAVWGWAEDSAVMEASAGAVARARFVAACYLQRDEDGGRNEFDVDRVIAGRVRHRSLFRELTDARSRPTARGSPAVHSAVTRKRRRGQRAALLLLFVRGERRHRLRLETSP